VNACEYICKFESSQKDESKTQSADSSKAQNLERLFVGLSLLAQTLNGFFSNKVQNTWPPEKRVDRVLLSSTHRQLVNFLLKV